jgi:hypothetical protein
LSLDCRSSILSAFYGLQEVICTAPGVLRNLATRLQNAPGGSTTRTFTLRVNQVDTALTCSHGPASTAASNTTDEITVAAGDILLLVETSTGSPATTAVAWSLEFDSDDAWTSMYSTNIGTAQSGFIDPFTGWQSAAPADCYRLIPCDGKITAIWAANTFSSVGVGNALNFYIYLNGVKQDGIGSPSVDTKCTITNVAQYAPASKVFDLPVLRGDSVYIGIEETGSYPSSWTAVGIRFEATAPGESVVAMMAGSDPSATLVSYAPAQAAQPGSGGWSTSNDFAKRLYGGPGTVTLRDLILEVSTDPGAGNTRTFALLKNGALPSGGPAGVVSTGSPSLTIDDTGSVGFADGDIVGPMQHTPFSTPTVTGRDYWSFVMTSMPPAPTGGGGGGGGIEPTAATLGTGIKRVFVRLLLGSSPYTEVVFSETRVHQPASWNFDTTARLLSISTITRELSSSVRGVEVRVVLSDADRYFRTLVNAQTISGASADIFVWEDEVRYADGEPYRLLTGKVYSHRALPGFQYELVLRDVLSEEIAILDDAPRIPPGRLSQAQFPGMSKEYEGRAIPIVLGECNDTVESGNITDVSQGVIPPVILGRVNFTAFGGINQNVIACIWSQCALAANGVWEIYFNTPADPYVRLQAQLSDFGLYLWTPGMPGWSDTGFTEDYADFPFTGPEKRRYTPLYVNADTAYAQPFLDGKILVAANLFGVTASADGTGSYMSDAPIIWRWLLENYLYSEYLTGNFAATPTFAAGFSIINSASISTTVTRLRTFGGGAYPVGFMLGREGRQQTLRHVLEELCAGVAMEMGLDRHGRLMLDVEDVTAAATVTLTDLMDIEFGEFEIWTDRSAYRNKFEYVHGFRYVAPSAPVSTPASGEPLPAAPVAPYIEWTSGLQSVQDDTAIANNGFVIRKDFNENYVVRDAQVALDVYSRLLARATGPGPAFDGPIMFRLRTSWQGLMKSGIEVELGTVIAMTHLEGLGSSGWTSKKGRVLKIAVDPMSARVTLEGRIISAGGGGE